ncbi:hypothetical protein ACLOJK_024673 [Asimina triloba]
MDLPSRGIDPMGARKRRRGENRADLFVRLGLLDDGDLVTCRCFRRRNGDVVRSIGADFPRNVRRRTTAIGIMQIRHAFAGSGEKDAGSGQRHQWKMGLRRRNGEMQLMVRADLPTADLESAAMDVRLGKMNLMFWWSGSAQRPVLMQPMFCDPNH